MNFPQGSLPWLKPGRARSKCQSGQEGRVVSHVGALDLFRLPRGPPRGSQYREEGGGLVTLGVVTGWPLSRRAGPYGRDHQGLGWDKRCDGPHRPRFCTSGIMSREEA